MIRMFLTLTLLGCPFLIFHFLSTGQYYDALKATVTLVSILALLVLVLTVRRNARNIGY